MLEKFPLIPAGILRKPYSREFVGMVALILRNCFFFVGGVFTRRLSLFSGPLVAQLAAEKISGLASIADRRRESADRRGKWKEWSDERNWWKTEAVGEVMRRAS